eukprot:750851-Hanusia_phi.AAC.2
MRSQQSVSTSEVSSGSQIDISFTLTLAAQYNVYVNGNATLLQGAPFAISVLPGMISGPQCTVTGGGLDSSMAGKQAEVIIQAVDQFGNQRTQGGVNFFFTAEGPLERSVSQRAAGSCSVSFSLTVAGTYSVSLTLLGDYLGSSAIGSSPYNMSLTPNTETLPGFVAVEPATATVSWLAAVCELTCLYSLLREFNRS